MRSTGSGSASVEPARPCQRPCTEEPQLPDDVVSLILDRLDDPADLLRSAGVNHQWRRRAQAISLVTRHLAHIRPEAALGLPKAALFDELTRQIASSRALARGRWRQRHPIAIPADLTLLRLSRNPLDGSFLLGQRPPGCVVFARLAGFAGGLSTVLRHPDPLSSLSVSTSGMCAVSASSREAREDEYIGCGMVQLWRRSQPSAAIVLGEHLDGGIFSTAAAHDGSFAAACLRSPAGREVRLWRVNEGGAVTATLRLPVNGQPPLNSLALANLSEFWRDEPRAPPPDLGRLWRHDAAAAAADTGYCFTVFVDRRHHPGAAASTSISGPLRVAPAASPPSQRRGRKSWVLGRRSDWRECILSPCGTVLLSRAADDRAFLWRFSPTPERSEEGAGAARARPRRSSPCPSAAALGPRHRRPQR